MVTSDDSPSHEDRPASEPLGEIQGSRGYGAGKGDIVNLVPPPDDLGVGAPLPTASGQDHSTTPSNVTQAPNDSASHPTDGEKGVVRLDTVQFAAGIALLIVVIYVLRDDPRALFLALVLGASGWYLGRLSYGLPI